MRKFLMILAVAISIAGANTLHLKKGYIKAHTEVLGDSTIEPATSRVHTSLSYQKSIESLKGKVWIYTKSLHSDNKERDKHMYETLGAKRYPKIIFTINRVKKRGNSYTIIGRLSMHGKSRRVSIPAKFTKSSSGYKIRANFSIKMTDFGIKPPKLLFLSVRDRVDISVYLEMR